MRTRYAENIEKRVAICVHYDCDIGIKSKNEKKYALNFATSNFQLKLGRAGAWNLFQSIRSFFLY